VGPLSRCRGAECWSYVTEFGSILGFWGEYMRDDVRDLEYGDCMKVNWRVGGSSYVIEG